MLARVFVIHPSRRARSTAASMGTIFPDATDHRKCASEECSGPRMLAIRLHGDTPTRKHGADQPLRRTLNVDVGPPPTPRHPTFPQVTGLQAATSTQSPIRHFEVENAVTRGNAKSCRRGDTHPKYTPTLAGNVGRRVKAQSAFHQVSALDGFRDRREWPLDRQSSPRPDGSDA